MKIVDNIIAEVKLNGFEVSETEVILFAIKNLDIDELIAHLSLNKYYKCENTKQH